MTEERFKQIQDALRRGVICSPCREDMRSLIAEVKRLRAVLAEIGVIADDPILDDVALKHIGDLVRPALEGEE